MACSLDAAIAEQASQQLGLITIHQCRALGLTDRMRRRRVLSHLLVPIGASTFRLAGSPESWRQRLLAACLDTGGVASHLAAASLWGMPRVPREAVEVLTRREHQPRAARAVRHRSLHLDEIDLTALDGIPVTTPARTLIDISARLTTRRLQTCLDDSVRRDLVAPDHLWSRIDHLRPGRIGVGRLSRLLEPGVHCDSWLERELLRIVEAAGLPLPKCQAPVAVDGRHFVLDHFWRAARFVVEVDGHGSHATRDERQADAERQQLLTSLGLRVIRFTYEDIVNRPAYVVATVRRFLRTR